MFTITCMSCGGEIVRKHTGRKRIFCSDHCRDQARRNRKTPTGAFKNGAGYYPSLVPRNAKNSLAISMVCNGGFAERPLGINRVPRSIIEIEIIDGRAWREIVSADGVTSQVSMLRPHALREIAPDTAVATHDRNSPSRHLAGGAR